MDVLLDSGQIDRENVHFVGLQSLLHAVSLAAIHYFFHVFLVVEIGHVPRVEHVVEVFEHLLVNDLGVHEQETEWLVLEACAQQSFLDVVPPVFHRIVFDNLDLPQAVVHYVGGQLG